tara:strand:+ start:83 stop:493 length:411 start_codon:yes stop_codon:yes gene_type:complete
MPSIVETLNIIKDEFSVFSDPRDKYVFLVDLAKDLEGLDDQEKNEINRIHGCTSQAWVTRKINGEKYFFSTDSDAMIVRGLLSLIERSFNNHTKEEILEIDGSQFLDSVGLGRSISSQRTNGFSNAISKIQSELLE